MLLGVSVRVVPCSIVNDHVLLTIMFFHPGHSADTSKGSDASVSRVAWFLIAGCFSSNQRSISVGEMLCLDLTGTQQLLPVLSASNKKY